MGDIAIGNASRSEYYGALTSRFGPGGTMFESILDHPSRLTPRPELKRPQLPPRDRARINSTDVKVRYKAIDERIKFLQRTIDLLEMSEGKRNYEYAIPFALDLLALEIGRGGATKTLVINTASICNLGKHHDLYNELLKMYDNPNDKSHIKVIRRYLSKTEKSDDCLRNTL